MSSANISNRIDTILGSFSSTRTVLADGIVSKDPILPAAKIGALTTRTSDSVGTLTMATGHGFIAADRLDIYWANADGTRGSRYGIVVGAVAVDSVPITGGAGDNLPLDEVAITGMVPTLESFPVDNAAMQALIVGADVPMLAVFMNAVPTVELAVQVHSSVDAYWWDVDSGDANPFAADVVNVYLSHGGTSTQRPKVLALVN